MTTVSQTNAEPLLKLPLKLQAAFYLTVNPSLFTEAFLLQKPSGLTTTPSFSSARATL